MVVLYQNKHNVLWIEFVIQMPAQHNQDPDLVPQTFSTTVVYIPLRSNIATIL